MLTMIILVTLFMMGNFHTLSFLPQTHNTGQQSACVIFKLLTLLVCRLKENNSCGCFGVNHSLVSPRTGSYYLVVWFYIIRIRLPLSVWLLWVCVKAHSESEWDMFHLAKYNRCKRNADLTETQHTLQDWHTAGRFRTKWNSTGSWVRR